MTAERHNRILGLLLLTNSVLMAIGVFIIIYRFSSFDFIALESGNIVRSLFNLLLNLLMIIVPLGLAAWGIILILPQFFGGAMILARAKSGKIWGVIAAVFAIICFPIGGFIGSIENVFAIICFPLGTIIGIYGLWFLLGDKGKQLYHRPSASASNGKQS